jgi:hypothetical protein|tara:strand:+ start:488 stop:793 length:306 start_codon:yes stop_codon:yes gene_type:complete
MGKSLLSDHSVVRADFDGLARRHHIGTNRHYVAPIFSRRDTTVFETAPFDHSGTTIWQVRVPQHVPWLDGERAGYSDRFAVSPKRRGGAMVRRPQDLPAES